MGSSVERTGFSTTQQNHCASRKRQASPDGAEEMTKRARILNFPRIPEISREMEAACFAVLAVSKDDVVVRIAREEVSRGDLETLRGVNRLNDRVMNAYLALIRKRNEATPALPSVYAFDTHFYTKFSTGGYKSVQRWTKNVDIFAFDMFLMPIHTACHWSMVVVDFRGKQIRYLDSFGGQNPGCLFYVLLYLSLEMKAKKNDSIDHARWNLKTVGGIPQQNNDYDCGVFALKYADYAARDVEHNFSQADIPYFRRRMLFELVQTKILAEGYGNVYWP